MKNPVTFRLSDKDLEDMNSCMKKRGEHNKSKVLRQGLRLWISGQSAEEYEKKEWRQEAVWQLSRICGRLKPYANFQHLKPANDNEIEQLVSEAREVLNAIKDDLTPPEK